MAADDPSHGRIMPEAVGIVDVFVAAEPPEGGLAEQPDHPVLSVLAGSGIDQALAHDLRQSERIIEFPKGKQASIRRDLRAVELQLQPTVEIEPQHPGFAFTRRVSHPILSNLSATY